MALAAARLWQEEAGRKAFPLFWLCALPMAVEIHRTHIHVLCFPIYWEVEGGYAACYLIALPSF